MKSNPETNSSKPETRVREMKKILIMLLTMSFISSNDNFTKSTMSILARQSSKVLTNFQGKEHAQSNSLMHAQSNSFSLISLMQPNLIYSIGRSIQIRQIDENTFEVISISQSDNRQSNRGISNRGLSKFNRII